MSRLHLHKILILGAGFGGLHTFIHLQKLLRKRKDVTITLLSNTNYFLFTPFLHEVATARVQAEDIIEPISKFVSHTKANVMEAEVQTISLQSKKVFTSVGEQTFDFLVVALGATNNFYGIPGAAEHCYTLKTLTDAVKIKNHFIELAQNPAPSRIAIIGAGPTGVELAAEASDFFREMRNKNFSSSKNSQPIEIFLIEQTTEILPDFSKSIQKKTRQILHQKNITILDNTTVTKITAGKIYTKQRMINIHMAIWTAGIQPTKVDFDTKSRDQRDCLLVEPTLELCGSKNVFILGDIAFCLDKTTQRPIPHLAQSAVQQAKTAAENIALSLKSKPLHHFVYQPLGQMVSLGEKEGVGEISRFSFSGRIGGWLWHVIHLSKLLSWEKRLNIIVQWLFRSFSARDVSKF